MASVTEIDIRPFRMLHLFAGIGGGSLGFKRARFSWRGAVGRFENLLAIDADPGACESYRKITGGRIECWDLFSRGQYERFHGQAPPAGWREITPADIREACGGSAPDGVFTSPPCKGLSGLLPSASAASDRYQALNELTVRGIRLVLEAFPEAPPKVLLLENVPRIKSRGRHLLAEIVALLRRHGYAVDQRDHDCGELGGLGQRRKRFLLIARHQKSLRPFIYQPESRPLKSVGDVIGPLPLPDAPEMGPMHRLPRLKWLTWLRLALIPAGGDWRDLQKIAPEDYLLAHEPRPGAYLVSPWEQPSGAVVGSARTGGSNGVAAVADPRLFPKSPKFNHAWPVADARMADKGGAYGGSPGLYGVTPWGGQAPAVTGSASVSSSNCAAAVADPRVPAAGNRHCSHYRIMRMAEPAGTVTGATHVANGAPCVADVRGLDHRLGCTPRSGSYGVQDWNKTSPAVIGAMDLHAGAAAIGDPRLPESGDRPDPPPVIIALDGTWHRPLTTLELAALQSFPVRLEDGSPLVLAGSNDGKWREWIGNAVPPEAARAIAEQIGQALLQNELGETFVLSMSEVWVQPRKGKPIFKGKQ